MSESLWDRIDARERDIVREYLSAFPVRVGEIARMLGIAVYRSPLPPNISGLIKPTEDVQGTYEIRVNKFESSERQRFTLAHEISHFLLHKADIRAGVVDSIMYRSALTSKKEAEANRLAADIVMPQGLVREELEALGGVSSEAVAIQLADMFQVSTPAMRIRLGIG